MTRRAWPRTALAAATMALALGCNDSRTGGSGGMDVPAGRKDNSAQTRPSPINQSPTNAAGGPAADPSGRGSPEVGATRETKQGGAAPAGSGIGPNGPGTGPGTSGPTDPTKGSPSGGTASPR